MVPRLALTASVVWLAAVLVALPAHAQEVAAPAEVSPTAEFVSTVVTPLGKHWRTWTAVGLMGSAVLLAAVAVAVKAPSGGVLLPSSEGPAWVVPLVQAGMFTVAISLGVAGAVMFLWPTELIDAATHALSQRSTP